MTAEKPPDFSDISELLSTVLQANVERSPIVLNCQLGRGRSTMTAVLILMIANWLKQGQGKHAEPKLREIGGDEDASTSAKDKSRSDEPGLSSSAQNSGSTTPFAHETIDYADLLDDTASGKPAGENAAPKRPPSATTSSTVFSESFPRVLKSRRWSTNASTNVPLSPTCARPSKSRVLLPKTPKTKLCARSTSKVPFTIFDDTSCSSSSNRTSVKRDRLCSRHRQASGPSSRDSPCSRLSPRSLTRSISRPSCRCRRSMRATVWPCRTKCKKWSHTEAVAFSPLHDAQVRLLQWYSQTWVARTHRGYAQLAWCALLLTPPSPTNGANPPSTPMTPKTPLVSHGRETGAQVCQQ